MPRGTFTEGRLESFERMMQSVPGRMKDYEPPKQPRKKNYASVNTIRKKNKWR